MNLDRIKLLEKYIEDEPKNPFNKYALAMEFFDHYPEKSLEILNNLIKEHPDYLPSYYKTAHLLWDNEDWKNAKATFLYGISLADQQDNQKALSELKSSYQNFLLEME